MIERLVQHQHMQRMRAAPGFRLGKIEVIILDSVKLLRTLFKRASTMVDAAHA